jgi:hypothetical protein
MAFNSRLPPCPDLDGLPQILVTLLQVLIAMVAGWVQRHQQQVIAYLQEENHVLKAQLGQRRLRLTDTQRRRLAALAHPLGRKRLKDLATLATPDTLMRWYHRFNWLRVLDTTEHS